MTTQRAKLLLQAAPFLKQGVTTPRLMLDVVLAMVPMVVAAAWFFGISALAVLATCVISATLMEAAFRGKAEIGDGSAALTGLVLGLTLPPATPLWIACVGSVVAIGLGKLIWGGLGHNLFNPALVGRAFLQAAFPSVMTTWSPPVGGGFLALQPTTLAPPFLSMDVDVVTAASPLAQMKFAHTATATSDLLLGSTAGSLGETSAILILVAGAFLAVRRSFDWRIPVSILLTVAVLSGGLWFLSPDRFPTPQFMLLSGGLLLGAVFMATDPVTSPTTPRGAWIFGFGIGALVVLIRIWGGLPEGVMYSILLMNATAPLIERVTQPRPFGRTRGA